VIKTDLEEMPRYKKTKPDSTAELTTISQRAALAYSGFVFLVIIGGLIVYLTTNSSSPVRPGIERPLGNQPALSITPTTSSNTGQTAAAPKNLSGSAINLQDNLPSGQGGAKTSLIQSANQAQSTGQGINQTQPY
jgi:hypothetical protein